MLPQVKRNANENSYDELFAFIKAHCESYNIQFVVLKNGHSNGYFREDDEDEDLDFEVSANDSKNCVIAVRPFWVCKHVMVSTYFHEFGHWLSKNKIRQCELMTEDQEWEVDSWMYGYTEMLKYFDVTMEMINDCFPALKSHFAYKETLMERLQGVFMSIEGWLGSIILRAALVF